MKRANALNVLRIVYDSISVIRGTHRAIISSNGFSGIVDIFTGQVIVEPRYRKYVRYGKVIAFGQLEMSLNMLYISNKDKIIDTGEDKILSTYLSGHVRCFHTADNRIICINTKKCEVILDEMIRGSSDFRPNVVYRNRLTGDLIKGTVDINNPDIVKDSVAISFLDMDNNFKVLFESGLVIMAIDYILSKYDQVYRNPHAMNSAYSQVYVVISNGEIYYTDRFGIERTIKAKQATPERIEQLKNELNLIEISNDNKYESIE